MYLCSLIYPLLNISFPRKIFCYHSTTHIITQVTSRRHSTTVAFVHMFESWNKLTSIWAWNFHYIRRTTSPFFFTKQPHFIQVHISSQTLTADFWMVQVSHQVFLMVTCGLSEYMSTPGDNQGHCLHFKRKSRVNNIGDNQYLKQA